MPAVPVFLCLAQRHTPCQAHQLDFYYDSSQLLIGIRPEAPRRPGRQPGAANIDLTKVLNRKTTNPYAESRYE